MPARLRVPDKNPTQRNKLTGKEKSNDECRMMNDELKTEALLFIHPSAL
jgi:hypothetical protein